jgi:hypothetical protein
LHPSLFDLKKFLLLGGSFDRTSLNPFFEREVLFGLWGKRRGVVDKPCCVVSANREFAAHRDGG